MMCRHMLADGQMWARTMQRRLLARGQEMQTGTWSSTAMVKVRPTDQTGQSHHSSQSTPTNTLFTECSSSDTWR